MPDPTFDDRPSPRPRISTARTLARHLAESEDKVVLRAEEHFALAAAAHEERIPTSAEIRDLFRQLVASVEAEDSGSFEDYSVSVARDGEDRDLEIVEVQALFNALEEALRDEVLDHLEADERMLAVEVTGPTMQAGRDAMAREYVARVRISAIAPPVTELLGEDRLVRIKAQGLVAIMTLTDPATRNALGTQMADQIIEAVEIATANGLRAIIVTAEPAAAVWSSGHDVRELPRGRRDPLAYDDPLERCLRTLRSCPLPIIAMVHGSVWGGALDLVLSCDVVIADESATFAITPANLGLPYNTTGLLHFFGRLPLNVVKEMFFSARPIDAEQAARWLLVNHLVPAGELEAFTLDLAETIASKAPLAIAAVKEQLRVLSDYQPVAAQVYERVQSLRRAAYDSDDYLEGLDAFAQKRRPNFSGH